MSPEYARVVTDHVYRRWEVPRTGQPLAPKNLKEEAHKRNRDDHLFDHLSIGI